MDKKIIWKNYSLDSVARLVSGRTPDREKTEYYAKEGTPWVKIENLDQGYITESSEYLSEEGRERVNLVPENSVLFSIVGTVGKVGIAGTELATNQQIVSLVFDEGKMDPLFGYYCLKYCADEIRQLSDQTTMALINRKTLGQYRITVPEDIEEQKKIAARLKKFEEYIYKKQKMYAGFTKYEAVLFRSIFQDQIEYHERLKMKDYLQEAVISGIPKSEEPDNDYPKLTPEDFLCPYLKETVRPEDDCDIEEKYLVKQGDILIRNGRLILAEEQKENLYIDRSVLRLRTIKGQLLPEVLYGYLNLPEIKETLYAERKAGDMRKRPIRGSELERMGLPYFTMDAQKEYARCLHKIRDIQKSLDNEIRTGWKTFQAVSDIWMNERQEEEQEKEVIQKTVDEGILTEEQSSTCHLILAILAGWCPEHDPSGKYLGKRQEIFRKAQPMFQPVALSFVTREGQKEYLMERDFQAYRVPYLCREWKDPLEFLKELLKQQETGEVLEAHLAFPGEEGILTEKDWDQSVIKQMAAEGYHLLAEYSGFALCSFLF